MQVLTADVKSGGNIVGQAEFNEYETVAEAVESKGEGEILELINVQEKTSAMNAKRQEATADQRKPTKKDLEAFLISASSEQFSSFKEIVGSKGIDELSADEVKALGTLIKEALGNE